MRVKFLRDFRGRETDEAFYAQGEVADISDAFALVLVADGVADRAKEEPAPKVKEVAAPKPEPVAAPEPAVEPEPPAEPEPRKGKR